MAANDSPRRLVVWADGSAQTASTVTWAAQHAAARSLPLHLLHCSEVAVPAGVGAVAPHPGFAERDPAAGDVAPIAHLERRIREDHRELSVSFQILRGTSARPDAEEFDDGDVLVTGPSGFRCLSGDDALPVPVVIVPECGGGAVGDRKVLLITGRRFSRALAVFAFNAAADLGTALDVVRVAPQSATFGDDYWIEPGGSAYLTEPRWRAESARLRTRFPKVTGASWILRTAPWATLGSMARTAHLAVVGAGAGRELRALLDIGGCPVAVVPEP